MATGLARSTGARRIEHAAETGQALVEGPACVSGSPPTLTGRKRASGLPDAVQSARAGVASATELALVAAVDAPVRRTLNDGLPAWRMTKDPAEPTAAQEAPLAGGTAAAKFPTRPASATGAWLARVRG